MFWWIAAGLAARLPLQPVPGDADVGPPASVSVAHDGTVWIAGERGVVRLGGAPRAWEVDRALAVCVDARGDAWAGSRRGVVLLGDDGPSPVAGATGEGYHLPVGPGGDCWVTPQGGVAGPLRRGDGGAGVLPVAVPAGVEVVALARDGGGRWWLGSSDGLYELLADRVREVPGTRGSKAFPLRAQGDVLWVGTGDGVLRVRGDDVSRPLAGQYVTGVAATPEATFVGTAEGALLRLGADGSGAESVGQGPPQALFDLELGPGGWLWGATWGGGLVRYSDAERTLDVFDRGDGLPSGVVQDLAVDREGTLWITTPLGVTRLAHPAVERWGAAELGTDELGPLRSEGRALWVGTAAGLARIGPDGVRAWPGPRVSTLARGPDGRWWTGGPELGGGLTAWDEAGPRALTEPWAAPDPGWVLAVAAAPTGVWVERYGADALFHVGPAGASGPLPLPDGASTEGSAVRGDDTWFVTAGPLLHASGDAIVPSALPFPDARLQAGVGQVWGDRATGTWLTCRRACGAVRWGQDGRVTRFDTTSGLPSDEVDWVWDGGGATWLGTRKGVVRVDGDEVGAVFGRGAGVPDGPSFAGAWTTDGSLWRADADGLLRLRPAHHHAADAPLGLALAVTVDGEPAGAAIPWGRSDVRAAATVRSFTDDAGLRYRWRLLPDGDWSAPDVAPTWSLPRLRPDAYQLEVEAAASDGRAESASVAFTVSPPWWGTWTSRLAAAAALAAAVAGAAAWRVRGVERARRGLEQEVAARTAELALANRRLAQASEAKSQYLANMSHELRTPLNAILGYTQLLADEARDDGRDTADLERVERAGTHLLALVNDVLDLSKIEAGRMEFTLGAVELGPLVADVLDALRPVIERAGATVTTDLPPGLVALADAHRVRQILTNLVGNAVKFTGAGAVALRGLDLDGALRIEVRDSGPGIPPDAAARLFRPFAQASASTARTHGGTGLGLVISRELARAMNGDVAFSSVPGAGATFWLDLPRG